MSQRKSGYKRIKDDNYPTPSWVTQAVIPHLPKPPCLIWEPAAGSGKIVNVLTAAGYTVDATDIRIASGLDFLDVPKGKCCDVILTNPPYSLAEEFILHALALAPYVAMLLRTDFDHAKTRYNLFANCSAFAKKVVLTKRIRWIEGSTGSPSYNHAWYLWDKANRGLPVLAYGP